nr:hypothetical protein CFP56_02154 [Quercus suber]
MDSLFDPIIRKWNEELVDSLFVVEDAELIKKIPLTRNVAENTLYWPYSTSENYSCRSSYRFLKEELEMQANPQAPPICDKKETKHALWSCPELDVVWADKEAWSFRYEIEFTGVKELLSWMIGEGKSLELFAYMAWNVWNQRNKG